MKKGKLVLRTVLFAILAVFAFSGCPPGLFSRLYWRNSSKVYSVSVSPGQITLQVIEGEPVDFATDLAITPRAVFAAEYAAVVAKPLIASVFVPPKSRIRPQLRSIIPLMDSETRIPGKTRLLSAMLCQNSMSIVSSFPCLKGPQAQTSISGGEDRVTISFAAAGFSM